MLEKIKNNPEQTDFAELIAYIDQNYAFSPTRFVNGEAVNEAGQNNGSCKVFSYAKMHGLDAQQTLHCFGDYYRKDVLSNPEGTDHQNIRNFIKFGWEGVKFEGEALK